MKGGRTKVTRTVFQKYPLLHVRWRDHASEGGWAWPKDRVHKAGLMCESVGFRIERNKNLLTLAQSIEEQGKVSDTITILTGTISSIRRIGVLPRRGSGKR